MLIKKAIAITVYNGEDKPIAICLMDEKSRKNIIYQVDEMPFDDIAAFLERLAKVGAGDMKTIKTISHEEKQ